MTDAKGVPMMVYHMPEDMTLLAAIAKVAIRHGQMDYALRMVIKSVSGVGIKAALDATERTTSAQLRVRILKLAKLRLPDGPARLRLEGIMEDCRRLAAERNHLLHALWAADSEGQAYFRSEGHSWRTIPEAGELERLADQMHESTKRLHFERLEGFLKEALEHTIAPSNWR